MTMKIPLSRVLLAAVILSVAFIAGCGGRDDISLSATVDKTTITIGDKIAFTIEITAKGGIEARVPDFKEAAIGGFEVKDSGLRTKERLFGKKTLYKWYSITIFSTGSKFIPPVEIQYKTKSEKDWRSKKTAAIPITVVSVLPARMPKDIKDIKGPIAHFEINWFVISFLCLLLLVAVIVIRSILRGRLTRPVRLPHETALEEIEAIRANFLKDGIVKEYFAGISDTVRRYVERVFRMKAPEMTTEEFLESLKEAEVLSVSQKDLLKGFLRACDLVKFAKYAPARAEIENIFAAAKIFIEETKPTVAEKGKA